MNGVLIYGMTALDIPEVLEIEALSFATPWSEAAFRSEIERNTSARYFVAKIDGRVVGYGGVWIIIDEGHITNVAVHPDYRGMRIGDAIVKAMIEAAHRGGASSMTLEVRRTNIVAQNLYRKYGFEPSGVRPRYYSDNGEDAIIMWKRNM